MCIAHWAEYIDGDAGLLCKGFALAPSPFLRMTNVHPCAFLRILRRETGQSINMAAAN